MDKFGETYKDMSWLFNHSAAALGFRSSFGAFVQACYGSQHSNTDDPMSDGLLAQTTRYRRIATILESLPSETRRALDATYNQQHRYPVELTAIYGSKTGCALFAPSAQSLDHLVRLGRAKLQKKLTDAQRKEAFIIGNETKDIYLRINQQYLEMKRRLYPSQR